MTISDFSRINHLIDEREAAEFLGCSVAALRKWRLLGKGPTYIKVERLVRYHKADLLAYLEANRVEPAMAGGAQ
jgi:hypothetical protein